MRANALLDLTQRNKVMTQQIESASGNDLSALKTLAKRKDVRTADRAVIRNLVRKLDRREHLTRSELLNAWAYIVRYGASSGDTGS